MGFKFEIFGVESLKFLFSRRIRFRRVQIWVFLYLVLCLAKLRLNRFELLKFGLFEWLSSVLVDEPVFKFEAVRSSLYNTSTSLVSKHSKQD